MTDRLSICPGCGTPVIATFAWDRFETYCLECGGHFGMFNVDRCDATPALVDRKNRLQAEWDEHAGSKVLIGSFWRTGCAECDAHKSYHPQHATDDERVASEEAIAWLKARVAA